MKNFKGLVAAPVTPFHEDGSINTAGVKPYAELLKANGVAGGCMVCREVSRL